ncbi:MAG TPA: ROK family protein [Acidimicrobiales bacterium]|nr:ROK family protein [Acidimicrobiales bacterium]
MTDLSGLSPAVFDSALPAENVAPARPFTLSIDVGGTGLKANVLGLGGSVVADRVKVPTTYPMPPEKMVERLAGLAAKLPEADRISCGFPGMVRRGQVLSAPHFVTADGPGSAVDPELVEAWHGFDLAAALSKAIGKPCRVANDADVQGAAVVRGHGFEACITLGTGFGTAFFMDGRLLPHQEFSHVEFHRGETFNDLLGEAARKKAGDQKWNKHVRRAIAYLDAMFFFDHLYIGGGNSPRVDRRDLGPVLERITVVDNSAGILGGIKLWEDHHIGVRGEDA